MKAREVPYRLLEAGRLLAEARSGRTHFGWADILERPELQDMRRNLDLMFRELDEKLLRQAIDCLTAEQEALRKGRPLASLPTETLNRHAELGGIKQLLQARQVACNMEPEFLSWLVEDALPVLQRSAPLLLALL